MQGPRGGGGGVPPNAPTTTTAAGASWSSYATVDPSTILSVLVKKAGFFLDPQLRSMTDLMHCDKAQLNVVNRELIIQNFTVALPQNPPSSPPALRIGRLYMTWDSYRQPCVELQVQDVDIVVEFTNLLLTRNNWNELNDLGFPPEMIYYSSTTNETMEDIYNIGAATNVANESEFVRIGNLDLQGTVVLHTRSRPLQKAITDDIIFNLQTIRDLNYKVRALADANLETQGRRGCTSEELYEVFRKFFSGRLKQAVQYAVEDIAARQLLNTTTSSGESVLVNKSKSIVSSAKASLLAYAKDMELLGKDALNGKLVELRGEDDDILLPDEEVERIVAGSLETIKETAKAVGVRIKSHLGEMIQAARTTDNNNEEDDDDDNDFFFPDW